MRLASLLVLALGLFFGGCTGLVGPQVTNQIRQSCYWVDETYLVNALAGLSMDRDAGFSPQQELAAFTQSCISACESTGVDTATCTINCTSCGTALVAEVWGY